MKDRSQLRTTRDQTVVLNDFTFNQTVSGKQILSRYSKKEQLKENFPSLNRIKSQTIIRRNKSIQCQNYDFNRMESQLSQNTNKFKSTENHSTSTLSSSRMISSESILTKVRSGDLDLNLKQKRKKLLQRRKEKIHFISDKLTKLNKINDQLVQLKGQIGVNKLIENVHSSSHVFPYFLNSIIQQNYNSLKFIEKKSVHFAHFEKNFLTLQYLQNEHCLVSRPPACQKVINLNKFILQPLPTLVLDLDQTLIWTQKSDKLIVKNAIYLKNNAGKQIRHEVHLRPFVGKFLEQISNFYQIIIFTAGSSNYINQVLRFLDPQRKYISQVLNREHATKFKNQKFEVYVKDLRVLNKNLSRTVFVDNCIYSYALQLENGIPIIPFNGDPKDKELEDLLEYLIELQNYSNMAERNDEVFMQSHFKNYFNQKVDTKTIIKQLYTNKLSVMEKFSTHA